MSKLQTAKVICPVRFVLVLATFTEVAFLQHSGGFGRNITQGCGSNFRIGLSPPSLRAAVIFAARIPIDERNPAPLVDLHSSAVSEAWATPASAIVF